jgi:methionine-S-sulfoxide reductase
MKRVRGRVVAGIMAIAAGTALFSNQGGAHMADIQKEKIKKATFAGGCFWCMEPPFEKLAGVLSVTAGYTGGKKADPTYEEVSHGDTGHAEAVEIEFDPARITYRELLEVFWRNIDPTDPGGQFADRGSQYRTAVYFHDEEQRREAEASKAELEKSGRHKKPVVTEIAPAGPFYSAEEYHQDYSAKNPMPYKFYRFGSGRDGYLKKVWGKEAEH